MKKEYSSPEFELLQFRFDNILSEQIISNPQIGDDDIGGSELD